MIASTDQAHVVEDTSFVLATAAAIPESASIFVALRRNHRLPLRLRDLPRLVLWTADVFGALYERGGLLDGLLRLARFFSFCASASARAFAFAVRFARRPFPGGFDVPVAGVLSGCLERSARAALRTGALKTSILHSDHISACSFIAPRSPAENEGYSIKFCSKPHASCARLQVGGTVGLECPASVAQALPSSRGSRQRGYRRLACIWH